MGPVGGNRAELGVLQQILDLPRDLVSLLLELAQPRLGREVNAVARARALERDRRGDQRIRPELADARVELLVALAERSREGEPSGVGLAEDLADHATVVGVVVTQPRQIDERRTDVGLIDPGPARAAPRHRRLAAVGPGGVGPVGGGGAVEAEVCDAGPTKPT